MPVAYRLRTHWFLLNPTNPPILCHREFSVHTFQFLPPWFWLAWEKKSKVSSLVVYRGQLVEGTFYLSHSVQDPFKRFGHVKRRCFLHCYPQTRLLYRNGFVDIGLYNQIQIYYLPKARKSDLPRRLHIFGLFYLTQTIAMYWQQRFVARPTSL